MERTGTQARARRVLLVDDDPDLVEVLAETLDLIGGYEVHTAADGATGLAQAFALQPACIIVDIRMPGLSGYQLVRALRGDVTTAHIPIIIMSALIQDRDALVGLLTGADAYLYKPVTQADLLAAIATACRLTPAERRERLLRLANGEADTSDS
jgi:DNA-binding response OmpR family regulator